MDPRSHLPRARPAKSRLPGFFETAGARQRWLFPRFFHSREEIGKYTVWNDAPDNFDEAVADADDNAARAIPVFSILGCCAILCSTGWIARTLLQPNASPTLTSVVELDEENGTYTKFSQVTQISDAVEVVKNFGSAQTWRQASRFVLDKERVAPLMEDYYCNYPDKLRAVIGLKVASMIVDGDQKYYLVSGKTADTFEPMRYTVAALSDGSYLIDWEALLAHNPVPWESYRVEKPLAPTPFRAFAKLSNHYRGQFEDRNEWLCVSLHNREKHRELHAYVRRYSTLGNKIALILHKRNSVPLIVSTKWPDDSALNNDQVYLHSLVQRGWHVRIHQNSFHHQPVTSQASCSFQASYK